jgi:exopolysaccharide production protein ExoQ
MFSQRSKHLMVPDAGGSVVGTVRAWLLLIPLLFLAVHGQPSFMQAARNSEGGTGLSATAEAGGDASGGLERAFVYAAYGVVLCLCLRSYRRILRTSRFATPLLLLAGLALCSALWSQVPLNSLRYGLYYLFDTLLAIYLLTAYSFEQLRSLLMMTGVAVALLSALTILFFPQYGIVHLADHAGVWQGIFSEKNDAAKNLMFLWSPVLGSSFFRWKNLLYSALILPFIAMTGSRSALVAIVLLVAFAVCERAFRALSAATAQFMAAALGLLVTSFGVILLVAGPRIAALLGRDITLTGRTDIWQLLIESGLRRPWFGYGYSAFWTGMDGESGRIYEELHWVFTYAHNGLLEVWLQLGWVGLALVLFIVIQAVRNAVVCARGRAQAGTTWLIYLLALTLLYNVDEGTILFTRSLVSMLFVLLCTGLARSAAARQPTLHIPHRYLESSQSRHIAYA